MITNKNYKNVDALLIVCLLSLVYAVSAVVQFCRWWCPVIMPFRRKFHCLYAIVHSFIRRI